MGAVAVLAAVVIGHAAIPGAGGVISACYNVSSNPSGSLRVIDAQAGAKCAKNEKLLTFNQTGPQGLKGDPGTPGTNGTDGVDGTNGTDGKNGVDGMDGAPGPAGPAGISTATFAGGDAVFINITPTEVASKTLAEGSWVVVATAEIATAGGDSDHVFDSGCILRSGNDFIGGSTDRRFVPAGQIVKAVVTITAGAQIAAGGGEVSLWCSSQLGGGTGAGGTSSGVDSSRLMILQIGGFS
jgi:collagen triple helix repeat protein